MVGPLRVPHVAEGMTDGRGTQLYIIAITMVVVAGFVVAARLLTIVHKKSTFGYDDACICLALLFSVVLTIAECEAVTHGYGEHAKDLGPLRVKQALKWFYVAQVFYKLVVAFDKLAILLFYLRIFPNRLFRMFTLAGLAFVGGGCIAFTLGTIWQCSPLPYFWDRSIVGGHCIPAAPWWVSFSALNLFADFYILILPIPLVINLKMPVRVRVGLVGIFVTGGFVCFATIIRITTLAASASKKDPTYDPIPATNWSVIEANTGLICACLPMLRRYFEWVFRFFRGASGDTIDSSQRYAQSGIPGKGYNLEALSKKEAIYGTGRQWGTTDNKVQMNSGGSKHFTESQENIVGSKDIFKTIDVAVHSADSYSDKSANTR